MGQGEQTGFVVVEGLDGAGTTTLARALADALKARDLRVCLTAEPSDGPLGVVTRAHIRHDITLDPQTAALAFTADRADHLARVIRPALLDGRWVVCDRYLLSTLAYQGVEGVDPAMILAASASFEVPDLTVFLDTADHVRDERISRRRGLERYEHPDLQERLRDAYIRNVERLRGLGYRILEHGGAGSPAEIAADILRELDTMP